MQIKALHLQSARFLVVGLISNTLLYLLYLALTVIGTEPKLAMTLLYSLGVLQTFVFNKRWTFSHNGLVGQSLGRYLSVYGVSYVINFSVLYLFVDILGWSHLLVQGGAIIVLAVGLFFAQKCWVFSTTKENYGR